MLALWVSVLLTKTSTDHKSLGKRFGVSGFPTLKWFDGKSADPIPYESGRDLEALQAFVKEKVSGLKLKAKREAPSNVIVLSDANFDKIVHDEKKDVLVEFYAVCSRGLSLIGPLLIGAFSHGAVTAKTLLRSTRRLPRILLLKAIL